MSDLEVFFVVDWERDQDRNKREERANFVEKIEHDRVPLDPVW